MLIVLWVYIGEYGSISIEDAFSGLSVLHVCAFALVGDMTIGIRSISVFLTTCERVTEVLLLDEFTPQPQETNKTEGAKLTKASFAWSHEKESSKASIEEEENNTLIPASPESSFLLTDVTFKVQAGQLVIVAGPVGSGKSTLLAGILKEIQLVEGALHRTGSVAYVPEFAWVIPGTIRDNIVLGQPFNEELYSLALQISDLGTDIQGFTEKDVTVIGESSLSGGQKARLGVARAVYADAELYLLDDPLSPVDSVVGARIFQQLRNLAKSGKSVILVTHQTQTLPSADVVVLLNEGRQVYCGKHEEITEEFTELIGRSRGPEAIVSQSVIPVEKSNEVVEAGSKEQEMFTRSGSIYTRFLSYAYKYKIVFVPIGLVLIVSQAAYLAVYYWLSEWTSASDQSDSFYSRVFGMIIVGCYVFGVLRFLLVYASLIRASKNIHNSSLESLVHTHARFFDETATGTILNRFTKDTATIDENVIALFTEAVSGTFILGGIIVLIVCLSPVVLIGCAISVVLVIVIIRVLLPITNKLRMVEVTSRGPLLSTVNSIVGGILTIRCLGVEQKFIDEMKQATTTNLKAFLSFYSSIRLMQFSSGFAVFIIVVANSIGIVLLKDYINPETAATTLALGFSVHLYASYYARVLVDTDNYMISPQRLSNYCELNPEPTNKQPFNLTHGAISFQAVYAKYAPHLPFALNGLTFNIPPKAKVGIIGRTGAGKSSILQVLFRLITPTSGTIMIDNQDYLQVGLTELRSKMSVIPQSPLIFRATFRENIDPFGEYTTQAITDVLAKVKLLEFVNQQPDGIDSLLSSDDVSLSAGQKQLICLARAIIKQAKITVMDEATANVDNLTDNFIQEMVRTSFTESTVLVIAHRLRTIIHNDLIVVMRSGECVEFGSPIDLIAQQDSVFNEYIDHTGPEEARLLREVLQG